MTKRYFALFWAILFIVTIFTACADTSTEENTAVTETTTQLVTDDESFKISYTQSDSLDPFEAESLNNQVLASLVFESLFDLDENYTVTPNIATGYEYTNATTLKVSVTSGLKFSDGSTITVSDIAYSFRAASKSPAYGGNLSGIASVTEDSGNTVIFHLAYENPYAHLLLTFPIASTEDDENGYPIGSGRYKYAEVDGGLALKANDTDGFSPHITTINLVNVVAADSIDNAVNIGNITYAFRDLSSDASKRLSCSKKLVDMNNLVYLGINSSGKITFDKNIRKAISLALDRETILKSAYSNYGSIATSVFHPNFHIAADSSIFSETADTSAAKQTVSQSGIKSEQLTLTLLVNENDCRTAAASLIKTQLEAVGFSVTVQEESYSEYLKLLKSGSYDLYIGETKIADDMNLFSFFSKDGKTNYGISLSVQSDSDEKDGNDSSEESVAEIYKKYLSGKTELGNFILSFSEEMPFVPLLYRKGMICYSKSMKGDMQGTYHDLFANIEDWYFEY